MYYVYLLESKRSKQTYVGSTNNLYRRLDEHNQGKEISTKRYRPWQLVAYGAYLSEDDVREREQKLKSHGNAIKQFKNRCRRSFKNSAGFTLLELLAVIAIISLLANSVFASVYIARAKGRDTVRVTSLKMFAEALEMYHIDHGKYPGSDAGGNVRYGFCYYQYVNGSCGAPTVYGNPRLDNTASAGFLSSLYPEYINDSEWMDPFKPKLGDNSSFNCRYGAPRSEVFADNVQRYLLHCDLENSPDLEENDGGVNDDLYEIMHPAPWVCTDYVGGGQAPPCPGFGL